MTTAQIAERKTIYRKIRGLSNADAARVMEFIDSIAIDNIDDYEPNAETAAILRESAAGRNVIGPFHNMNDFMTSLLSDDDA